MRSNKKTIQHHATTFLRLTLGIALISEIINQRWLLLFTTTLILILTYIPQAIERRYNIQIPIEFEFIIILFIYASLFLGEIRSYYTRYWWWDIILHTSSGLALGFIGFLILYILYAQQKIQAKPFWIALFAFCFALAIGSVWEIIEFIADQLLGTTMQKSGLIDTMWDLIVDAVGALITSFIGYFYIRGKHPPLFTRLINKFVKENPKYFQK
jgi:uncharacterized membrane protein YccC